MNPKHFIDERDFREYVGSTLLITLRPREVAKGHRALPLYLTMPNVWRPPSQKKKKIVPGIANRNRGGNFSPFPQVAFWLLVSLEMGRRDQNLNTYKCRLDSVHYSAG